MPISKIKLPDNTTQDVKDSRLPDVTSSDDGKALIVSSGAWGADVVSAYRLYHNYERRYLYSTNTPLYRYKLCGFSALGKLIPLTITNQTSTTQVSKTPTSVGLDPTRGIAYYNSATNITSTSSAISNLYRVISTTLAVYTFNTDLAAKMDIFLEGSYDASSGLFYLNTTTNTSWYVQCALDNASTYMSVLTSGKYYWYVGSTFTTANYLSLVYEHPLYYYDGSKLIPVNLDTRVGMGDLVYEGDALGSATYTAGGEVVDLSDYQLKLVSGTNIKTINSTSLLGSGNISITVPTISTNIASDATSDTKTASPKSVKTYVDGIVGDIETLLAAI